MSDLTPYFSKALPFSPQADKVQPKRGGEEISGVAHSLQIAHEHITRVRQETAKTKALLDFSNLSTEMDSSFYEYSNSLKMDEDDVAGKMKSYINDTIKPRYHDLIRSIPDHDVRRAILLKSEDEIRQFRTKGLHYESGLRLSRASAHAESIAHNSGSSLLLDGSDANFLKQQELLKTAVDGMGIDPKGKEGVYRKGLDKMAQAQAQNILMNDSAKLKPFLNISTRNSSPLKADATINEILDNAPLEVVSPGVSVEGAKDPSINEYIPFEGWKYLSTEKKISTLHSVAHSSTQGKQEERSRVGTKVKDIASFLRRGIIPEQSKDSDVAEDHLISVFGETHGKAASSQLKTLIDLAPKINLISTMPIGQAEEELAKLKPDPKELTGAEFKNKLYGDVRETIIKNIKERKEHPIKWAIANGLTGEMLDDPAQWGAFFTQRRELSQTMDKMYGVKSPLLSKEEGRKLTERLEQFESAEVVAYLQNFAEHIGGLGSPDWIETCRKLEHPVIGEVGLLLARNPDDASDILRGYKYRTRNRGDNIRDETNERFDVWFKEAFHRKYGSAFAGVSDRGDVLLDRASRLVGYHLAGQLLRDKKYTFTETPAKQGILEWIMGQNPQIESNLEDSFKAVMGNTPIDVGNGSYLIPPRGMDHESFTDKFKEAKDEAFRNAGYSAEPDSKFENFSSSDGSTQYRATFGRSYIADPKTGEPLEIEVRSDSGIEDEYILGTLRRTGSVMKERRTGTNKELSGKHKEDNK